jgi:hypothetical protein
MKNAPTFLVAKYIPDSRRMEPRNIGVILWADGKTAVRFIGETDGPEVVAPDRYPSFIKHKNYTVYRDWVKYWRDLSAAEALPTGKKDETVSRNSPEFLEALRLKSRENYILVQGGFLASKVGARDLHRVSEELYGQFVDDGRNERFELTESRLLSSASKEFVKKAGFKDNPNFHERYPLKYTYHGISRTVEFTYGIAVGGYADMFRPDALMQTARLSDIRDVNNALLMLEGVTKENKIVPKNRCAALVYRSGQVDDERAQESIKCLETVSTVIDLSNIDLALDTAYRMGLLIDGRESHPL